MQHRRNNQVSVLKIQTRPWSLHRPMRARAFTRCRPRETQTDVDEEDDSVRTPGVVVEKSIHCELLLLAEKCQVIKATTSAHGRNSTINLSLDSLCTHLSLLFLVEFVIRAGSVCGFLVGIGCSVASDVDNSLEDPAGVRYTKRSLCFVVFTPDDWIGCRPRLARSRRGKLSCPGQLYLWFVWGSTLQSFVSFPLRLGLTIFSDVRDGWRFLVAPVVRCRFPKLFTKIAT